MATSDLMAQALLGQLGQRGGRQDGRRAVAARLMAGSPPAGPLNNTAGALAYALSQGLDAWTGARMQDQADREDETRRTEGLAQIRDYQTRRDQQQQESTRQLLAGMGINLPGAPSGGTAPAMLAAPNDAAPSGPAPRPEPVTAEVLPPPDLMPHFQRASEETGIPVPVLVAQARQESNFRPDAVGAAGEIGVMQIKPSTARQPGFGLPSVDPETLRDPGANIRFGAQYLRARAGQGDWNDPTFRANALRTYNGGGDPNYAQNVERWMPGGSAAGSAGNVPNWQGLALASAALGQNNPTMASIAPLAAQFATQQQAQQQRRDDQTWRERQAAEDRAWRERQAEEARIAREQAAREQREGRRMTPTEVNLREETENALNGARAAQGALTRALELSPQAYAGPMAQTRGAAASMTGFDSRSGAATREFDSIMTEQALSQLRVIFGGNPTEGERQILLEMQASANMSRESRERLIRRALDAVSVREQQAARRLQEIVSGNFGRFDQNFEPPQPPDVRPAPPASATGRPPLSSFQRQ
jgi:hypothetical protein